MSKSVEKPGAGDSANGEKVYRMSDVLKKYRGGYKKVQRARGVSLNNGDPIAKLLEPINPEEMPRVAEVALGLEEGELLEKYGHLNNGQIRMNCGNRIRNAVKRGDLNADALKAAIKACKPVMKKEA
jgi:hypothetical protein